MDRWIWLLGIPAGIVCAWVLAKVAAKAYFGEKRRYQEKLMRDLNQPPLRKE